MVFSKRSKEKTLGYQNLEAFRVIESTVGTVDNQNYHINFDLYEGNGHDKKQKLARAQASEPYDHSWK